MNVLSVCSRYGARSMALFALTLLPCAALAEDETATQEEGIVWSSDSADQLSETLGWVRDETATEATESKSIETDSADLELAQSQKIGIEQTSFAPNATWATDDSSNSQAISLACNECGDTTCSCEVTECKKKRRPGYVFGEFLYLRSTGGDVSHAQQQNGIGGAGTVPFGSIGTVNQDFEPGFRVGFGCYLDECSSITGSYTFFESSSTDVVDLPIITGGGGAVGSLVHHPQASLTASVGPVEATQSIDFQMADVMFRDMIKNCGWCNLHYSAGAVYGNLEQDFGQTGVFSGGSAGTIDTDTEIDFSGGGLKFGIDGERCLGCGVSFYGKASAAAMTGRFDADYSMLNSTTAVQLAAADWDENRVVSHFEYEIGLMMKTSNDRLRVSAGYQFQHWGNVVTTADWIDAVQADNYTDLGDTLSFDGLTARIEGRW